MFVSLAMGAALGACAPDETAATPVPDGAVDAAGADGAISDDAPSPPDDTPRADDVAIPGSDVVNGDDAGSPPRDAPVTPDATVTDVPAPQDVPSPTDAPVTSDAPRVNDVPATADVPAAPCGNGRVDPGETCDTAIRSGPGACVTACNDGVACTTDTLANAGTCTAACATAPITAPRAGDGCCPMGATVANDSDCAARCGDGVRSMGETCDTAIRTGMGACPASCNDGNACTTDTLANAGTCTASCTAAPITAPRSGDGCCPPGATLMNDSDCTGRCGDGVVSMGETCDTAIRTGMGACPTTCAAPNACTAAILVNAGTCAASCSQTAITAPRNGDGCCPPGATIATDTDCPARCGDAVVSRGETCDTAIRTGVGACVTACNDGNACTTDFLANAGTCTASCTATPITAPRSGDGCCPPGATIATDTDCRARCGDLVVSAGEQCDDGNTAAGDGCSATCQREPRAYRITALTVQEPHFFFIIDITSNVNGEIANALTMDRSMPADGAVDFSPVLYFNPLDQLSTSTPLTVDFARCTLPLSATTCTRGAMPANSVARNTTAGTTPCLAPLAGTFPAGRGINSPAPACFASDAVASLLIDLAGTPLRLRNARIGAQYSGNPATQLQTGLISGFLTQADGDATRLPSTVAIVGGRTISSLLRAADQDRLADGTVGWWFYLNFTAAPVRYTP